MISVANHESHRAFAIQARSVSDAGGVPETHGGIQRNWFACDMGCFALLILLFCTLGYFGVSLLDQPAAFCWMDRDTEQVRVHEQSLQIELAMECGHTSISVTTTQGETFLIDLSRAHVGPFGFYFLQTCAVTGDVRALNYVPSPVRPPRQHPLDVYHRILGQSWKNIHHTASQYICWFFRTHNVHGAAARSACINTCS